MSKFTILAVLAAVTLGFGATAVMAGEDCGGCCKDKAKKETKDKGTGTGDKAGGETKTN